MKQSKAPKSKKNIKASSYKKNKKNYSSFLRFKGFLSFLILHELSQRNLCGSELAVRIGRRKGSILTPGAIYPTLKRLRKMKLISYKRKGREKVYSLTDLGFNVLDNQYVLFSRYFYGLKKYIRRDYVYAKKIISKTKNYR